MFHRLSLPVDPSFGLEYMSFWTGYRWAGILLGVAQLSGAGESSYRKRSSPTYTGFHIILYS